MSKISMKYSDIKKYSGFTLIELAVVMIVVGLLIASFSPLFTLQLKQKKIDQNRDTVASIVDAMSGYRNVNGHYPCPASVSANREDVAYGHVGNCTADLSVAVGDCNGDYCIQQGLGTVVKDPVTGANVTITPRVRVGAVPFRELNLTEDALRDAYGNLITYALTEDLGESATFDGYRGGISILNDQDQSTIEPENSAHFVILSHGPDGTGAMTPDDLKPACPSGLQKENCFSSSAVYRSAQYNGVAGDHHFDDLVSFNMNSDLPLWEKSDPLSPDIHHKEKGEVGVSYSSVNEQLAGKGSIKGEVRAQDGVKAMEICDTKGEDCFSSNSVAGQLDQPLGGMKCPDGYYMTGISKGAAECAPNTSVMTVSCEEGYYLTGINEDGTAKCKELAKACPATIVNVCDQTFTLPAMAPGKTTSVSAGASFVQKYKCNKGVWQTNGNNGGLCVCNADVETRNQSCGEGFTGSTPQTRTRICPSGDWGDWKDSTTNPSTCLCVNSTKKQTLQCSDVYGAGYSGKIWQESVHDCTTAAGTWGDWKTTKETCSCSPYEEPRDIKCTGNTTGTIHQTRQHTCPDTNQPWVTKSGECTCKVKTEQDKDECPPGQDGEIVREHTLICPDQTWGPWTVKSNSCKPIPPATCRWKSPGGGYSSTTRIGLNQDGASCKCGTSPAACYSSSGSGFINYTGCTCE